MGNSPSIKPSIVTIITYEEALTRISNEEFEHLESSYDELLCVPDKISFVTKAFLGFPEKFAGITIYVILYQREITNFVRSSLEAILRTPV